MMLQRRLCLHTLRTLGGHSSPALAVGRPFLFFRIRSQQALREPMAGYSTRSPICRHTAAMTPGGSVEASDATHPDFQPRAVTTDVSAEEIDMIKKDINETIRDESVVIFIKGVPEAPMCAYSKKMVDVMECLGLEYTSFDVLAHPVVRGYVKEVSAWPTIPQLFIKGEFAGGLDIVLQMAQAGDLQQLLDSKGIKHRDQKL